MKLTTAQRDRAVGAVLGMSTGDALGAGYEYGIPQPADQIAMIGGGLGPFEPGEWTDDTSMALPILDAVAEGRDLLDPVTQDRVASAWVQWMGDAKDVGITTATVLREAHGDVTANALREIAREMYYDGRSAAGNGSLMRTTPVVLAYLDDPDALTAAARAHSDMTHGDPEAADACVLWNHAQRHAILHGEFDMEVGLEYVRRQSLDTWAERIAEAGAGVPRDFAAHNGWVVKALQAAWAAISSTDQSGPEHFERSLREAVAAGEDTDTVAAIAGGLLGARWGVSAIPLAWRRVLHGWPGRTGQDLVHSTVAAITGQPWSDRFYEGLRPGPKPVQHPHDEGVWIGDVFGLRELPDGVEAVVSLCRIGHSEGPATGIASQNHVQVWLLDSSDPADNPHLEFVAHEAVSMIAQMREQGNRVYVHCVQARSRTPFIAALYGAKVSGRSRREALDDVNAVLPGGDPNPRFRALLS